MTTLDNLQDADGTLEEQKNNTTENQTPQEEVENVEKQQHTQINEKIEVSELKSVKQTPESLDKLEEIYRFWVSFCWEFSLFRLIKRTIESIRKSYVLFGPFWNW